MAMLKNPMWVFPKIMVPQNGWFIRENPIKMDDLGAHPYFWKHPCDFLTENVENGWVEESPIENGWVLLPC